MAYLIGTAGHVDHGKTTLIAALTGIDADRLPEEKSRGMTIDIGFAYIDLYGIGRVSIVDVPGHERFIKNMLAGASGVDVALLCVAADEGVMPQTREHFQIIELLEAKTLVVALTKSDLADEDTMLLAELGVRDLINESAYASAPIVRVSARNGSGLDELKAALSSAVLSLGPRQLAEQWILPIDRVFSVAGHGTVVTGTLAAGSVGVGSEGVLLPGGDLVRIRSIQTHGASTDTAEAGQRTAMNVAGIKKETLHRGQALGSAGTLFETTCFNVRLRPVAELKHGSRVRVHIGAGEFLGKLFLFDEAPNIGQIRTEEPVACALGQRVVLRRYSPPDVIAGAEITTPNASPRRKSDAAVATFGSASKGRSLADRIADELERHALGADTSVICEALGQSPQTLGDDFERLKSSGRAFGYAGIWLSALHFQSVAGRVRDAALALHRESPQASSVPRARVLQESKLGWNAKAFDRLVAHMADEGLIRLLGGALKHPDYEISLNDKQQALLGRTIEVMRSHKALAPSASDLSKELRVPIQAVEEMLRLGLETGRLAKVDDGVYYPNETLDELRQQVRSLGEKFTVAQFRDATGSSRKYALPILQYFDETRFTKRVGDERIVIG